MVRIVQSTVTSPSPHFARYSPRVTPLTWCYSDLRGSKSCHRGLSLFFSFLPGEIACLRAIFSQQWVAFRPHFVLFHLAIPDYELLLATCFSLSLSFSFLSYLHHIFIIVSSLLLPSLSRHGVLNVPLDLMSLFYESIK